MSQSENKISDVWVFPSFVEIPAAHPEPLENEIPQEMKLEPVANVKNEIEPSVKESISCQVDFLNDVLSLLKNPLSILDKEIIELIQYVISKAVKKLIYKELKTDKHLILKIIKELSQIVDAKGGLLNVSLSEEDYHKVNMKEDGNILFKIDSSLTEGDVILSSNTKEIRATLNERINNVLGIKYG